MDASVARFVDPFVHEAPRLSRTGRLGLPFLRRQVLARLARITDGVLYLSDESGLGEGSRELVFGDPAAGHAARLRVHDPRFYSQVAFGGSIGAAEAYMSGHWTSDDPTSVVRLLLRNRPVLEDMEKGWARFSGLLKRLFHHRRANSRLGSRRNIVAHYDLGNDFYSLFLDRPTMTYSCALFERPETSLEEAAVAKLERLCQKLELGPDDHVLEIGTGWGGFALHAAARRGCRVTTTTISPSQYRFAKERVAAAGLEDRITVLERDYRDLEGRFDKLVSIEMIEAVGLEHLDTFFARAANLLADNGTMALQSITLADRLFERYRRSVDFIQRYVFPGSAVPSIGALTAAIARASDLTVVHLEDIGPHYATTLRAWNERFQERLDEARRMGFSEPFLRMWEFYFAYCEGGFLERAIGDVQILLAKPGARQRPVLGSLG